MNDPMGKATVLTEQFQSVFSPRHPLPLKSHCNKALNFLKPSGKPVETLSQRRVDSRLTMMFKLTRGLVDTPIGNYVKVQRDDPSPTNQYQSVLL